ncbi:MAG: hypothetical protein K2X01_07415 [Cyanobacteria bacterium]|nr:hypothetical protein [Cyanobacteriota bacterium]
MMAWNQALDKATLGKLKRGATTLLKENRVKRLYSTSAKPIGTDRVGVYCADCQNWMAKQSFFSPETQVLTLEKEANTGTYKLRVRVLKDYEGQTRQSKINAGCITTALLEKLPLDVSDKAKAAMARLLISEDDCRNLLMQAQGVVSKTQMPSVAAMVKNVAGTAYIESVPELHWTPRWPSAADLTAAHAALSQALKSQEMKNETSSRVVALAYMGYATPPEIPSLGRLSQGLGGLDTLMIRPAFRQNNQNQPVIAVRTLNEELPFVYASSVNKQ